MIIDENAKAIKPQTTVEGDHNIDESYNQKLWIANMIKAAYP